MSESAFAEYKKMFCDECNRKSCKTGVEGWYSSEEPDPMNSLVLEEMMKCAEMRIKLEALGGRARYNGKNNPGAMMFAYMRLFFPFLPVDGAEATE